jgi:hypothetical protein
MVDVDGGRNVKLNSNSGSSYVANNIENQQGCGCNDFKRLSTAWNSYSHSAFSGNESGL